MSLSNISDLPIFAESVISQRCSLERDLVLEKNQFGQWRLINLNKNPLDQKSTIISGQAFILLIRAIANNSELSPLEVDDEVARIVRDPQRCSF